MVIFYYAYFRRFFSFKEIKKIEIHTNRSVRANFIRTSKTNTTQKKVSPEYITKKI